MVTDTLACLSVEGKWGGGGGWVAWENKGQVNVTIESQTYEIMLVGWHSSSFLSCWGRGGGGDNETR